MTDGPVSSGEAAASQPSDNVEHYKQKMLLQESKLAALQLKSNTIEELTLKMSEAQRALIRAEEAVVAKIEKVQDQRNRGLLGISVIGIGLGVLGGAIAGPVIAGLAAVGVVTGVAVGAATGIPVGAAIGGAVGAGGSAIGSFRGRKNLSEDEMMAAEQAFETAKKEVERLEGILKKITSPAPLTHEGTTVNNPLDIEKHFTLKDDVTIEALQKSYSQALTEALGIPTVNTMAAKIAADIERSKNISVPKPSNPEHRRQRAAFYQQAAKVRDLARDPDASQEDLTEAVKSFKKLSIDYRTWWVDGDTPTLTLIKVPDHYDALLKSKLPSLEKSLTEVQSHLHNNKALPSYLEKQAVEKQLSANKQKLEKHAKRIKKLKVNPYTNYFITFSGVVIGLGALAAFTVLTGGIGPLLGSALAIGIGAATFALPTLSGIAAALLRGDMCQKELDNMVYTHESVFEKANLSKLPALTETEAYKSTYGEWAGAKKQRDEQQKRVSSSEPTASRGPAVTSSGHTTPGAASVEGPVAAAASPPDSSSSVPSTPGPGSRSTS